MTLKQIARAAKNKGILQNLKKLEEGEYFKYRLNKNETTISKLTKSQDGGKFVRTVGKSFFF